MRITVAIWLATAMCVGSVSAEAQDLRRSYELSPASVTKAGPNTSTSNANSQASATTSSQGGSGQGVGSQGQSLTIDSHAVYEGAQRSPVATAVAPQLISSNDTCMGSSSLGGSAVSFGFSLGTTWTDNNCLMLKNAREIWNMGFKGAALARMCMDDLNKEAFEATGINCPARRSNSTAQASTGIAQPTELSSVDGVKNTDYGYRN
jgi:hypothetical protein